MPLLGSPEPAKEFTCITSDDLTEIKNALEGGRMADAVSKIKENLNAFENIRLNIAITGESGSGKSTFINVIRNLGDEDTGAAETGVVETTYEPQPYPHPQYPNVTFWDLPGIGTPNFKSETYLEDVKFSRYDFFIILGCGRFRDVHAQLARAIQETGKRFYFARSKVDTDLEACKRRRPKGYDEQRILQEIREDCVKCVQAEGIRFPQIFLLCIFDLDKYDFQQLQDTLEHELPSHKSHTLLLAMPNISLNILLKKKAAFQGQIWKLAALSAGVAAVPVPGLSVACDVTILVKALRDYCKSFGLDDESLTKLAQKFDKPVEELKAVIKSPLAKEISANLVYKLLTNAVGGALMCVEYLVSNIPVIGSLAAGGISYGTTYYMLNSFLNEVAEDAQRVLLKNMYPDPQDRMTMAYVRDSNLFADWASESDLPFKQH
uniref:IRG-type G domain-containing protein n=1 Tax=Chelydra serpentina TaxID=8475 RepID=A0A8C3S4Z6_CHESE